MPWPSSIRPRYLTRLSTQQTIALQGYRHSYFLPLDPDNILLASKPTPSVHWLVLSLKIAHGV